MKFIISYILILYKLCTHYSKLTVQKQMKITRNFSRPFFLFNSLI